VSGLETLGIALAGGSVGAILTRMFGVPAAVKDHNREASEIDERLGQWVSDECVRLERELERHKNESASQGQLTAGAYVTGIAHLKEEFLHLYRDQGWQAEEKIAALRDAEGPPHRIWRLIAFRGRLPELTTPGRAEGILDGWRAEVVVDGVGKAPVSDPTRRPLSWAIDKYGSVVPGNQKSG
jgi:hypothetical protein